MRISLVSKASTASVACWVVMSLLAGCGGSGSADGVKKSTGATLTSLQVEGRDADGDNLNYQWRVTAGSIDNRNASATTWSLPDGPGMHFAYVLIGDGRGGYIEQQYAVSSDAFKIPAPLAAPASYSAPAVVAGDDVKGGSVRLRFIADFDTTFHDGAASGARNVYLPDVRVSLTKASNGEAVYSGTSSLGGELTLPALAEGEQFNIVCSGPQGNTLEGCSTLTGSAVSQGLQLPVKTSSNVHNLRLYGHVGLADGGLCGVDNAFFGVQSSATVQVLQSDGSGIAPPVRVNRFGDYALDAAVLVSARLKLRIRCEAYSAILDLPTPTGGYLGNAVEFSHVIPNTRPAMVRMLANGPDGNVRGQMVVPVAGAFSVAQPRSDQFLTYKGADSRVSACNYYRAFGAVKDCDAQGNMLGAITLEDWKRENRIGPYRAANEEVSATYVNQRDLNLVRRMVATQAAPDRIAFVVCNHPGPDGDTQRETNEVIDTALADEKRVACVAMEYSPATGRSDGKPFTKFLTFGPDGKLVLSVNLDGRGEKYMPGACVACHGGATYLGRFPESGHPSPDLKANFLPFDTGNYLFSTRRGFSEAEQSAAIRKLNDLVVATQPATATRNLIQGWYAKSPLTLDKTYVPPAWVSYDTVKPGAARFYREVVGTACRTCHAAMQDNFDWDAGAAQPILLSRVALPHVCGGKADLYANASMPNALMSLDKLQTHIQADPSLATLVVDFLGCSAPAPDPVYPRR